MPQVSARSIQILEAIPTMFFISFSLSAGFEAVTCQSREHEAVDAQSQDAGKSAVSETIPSEIAKVPHVVG
jgi:hypothetical protein